MMEALEQLDLTADQQAQVEQILKTARQENRNAAAQWREEFRAAREQMAAARQTGDAQAVKAAAEKIKAITQKRKESLENLKRQLAGVLSGRQMAKLERLLGPGARLRKFLRTVRQLELDEDQKDRLDQIVTALKAEAQKQTDPAEKAKLYRSAFRKVMALLSDSQKDQLKHRSMAKARQAIAERMFEGLDLSEQQTKAIAKIMADARKRIFEEVLTDQQREKLRKRFQAHGRARARGRASRAGKADSQAADLP